MTTTPTPGWSWFRDEIAKGVAFSERYCTDFLDLVEGMDTIVTGVLERPTSPLSDRPQDYVVSVLVSRVCRLTVSALYIGLGGYPDSATTLQRTVWEIGIRLLDMSRAPVASAFGFLLDGAVSKIGQHEAEIAHRTSTGLPGVGRPAKRLERLQEHYEALQRLARDRGFDPETIRRTHGKLNFRQVCKDFGIETAYLVEYAFTSDYVHEKHQAALDYIAEVPGERQFHLGPVGVPGGPTTITIDVLTNAALSLTGAARIIEDDVLVRRADEFLARLDSLRAAVESGPTWPTV